MYTYRLMVVAVLLTGFIFACGDDNPVSGNNGVKTISDLAGTWEAVKNEYTNKANTSQKVDDLSDGLAGVTLKIQSNGSFEITISLFGTPFMSLDGTARVQGNQLIMSYEGFGEIEYEYTLENDRLTTIDNDSEYDFDGDGNEEPATEVTVFVKA